MTDRKIKMFIGSIIWDISETMHWPLGKYAPMVFGWMIGLKYKRIKK